MLCFGDHRFIFMTTPPKIDVSHQQRQIIIMRLMIISKTGKNMPPPLLLPWKPPQQLSRQSLITKHKATKNQDEIKTINLEMFWGTGDVKKFVSFRYCWLGHAFINVVIYIYCFVLFRIKKDIRYKNLWLKHYLHLSWNVHIFYELSFHFVTVCVFHDVLLYIRFYLSPNQFIFLCLVSI